METDVAQNQLPPPASKTDKSRRPPAKVVSATIAKPKPKEKSNQNETWKYTGKTKRA